MSLSHLFYFVIASTSLPASFWYFLRIVVPAFVLVHTTVMHHLIGFYLVFIHLTFSSFLPDSLLLLLSTSIPANTCSLRIQCELPSPVFLNFDLRHKMKKKFFAKLK